MTAMKTLDTQESLILHREHVHPLLVIHIVVYSGSIISYDDHTICAIVYFLTKSIAGVKRLVFVSDKN